MATRARRTAIIMMRGAQMLGILLKIEAAGFSDKLDVKHERDFFFLFLSIWKNEIATYRDRGEKTIGGWAWKKSGAQCEYLRFLSDIQQGKRATA